MPNDSCDQMNYIEEILSGSVIARGNAAALLESGEEAFDQVSSFIQMTVVVTATNPFTELGRPGVGTVDFETQLLRRRYS